MAQVADKAAEVSQRGYCLIESVYDGDECRQIRSLFGELCSRTGGFSRNSSRLVFHPLLGCEPELAPFFAKAPLIETMAAVFQDQVRLAHSGAAVNDNALSDAALTGWHNHYRWEIPPQGLRRRRPERLLCNVYVDGVSAQTGPLVVLPRQLNDPLEAPGRIEDVWEGQTEVQAPPGSAVIFDTAVWHCSRRGTAGLRYLWGGHYQGWSNRTPHEEDNSPDNPRVNELMEQLPLLKGLLAAAG